MTVKEIVVDYIKTNGFDGLCGENCGCGLDDLMPCSSWDGSAQDCKPAYKIKAKCSECGNQCEGYDDERETDCFTTRKPNGR